MESAALGALVAKAGLLFAAFVGALTGAWLSRPHSRTEYVASVLIAFFASVFVAPALIAHFLPNTPANSPIVGAVYWLVSTLAMGVIPAVRKRASKIAKDWQK